MQCKSTDEQTKIIPYNKFAIVCSRSEEQYLLFLNYNNALIDLKINGANVTVTVLQVKLLTIIMKIGIFRASNSYKEAEYNFNNWKNEDKYSANTKEVLTYNNLGYTP